MLLLCGCCTELDKSQRAARDLEHRMRDAERERLELQEAQQRAEEARRVAEQAAYLEKTEREAKVCFCQVVRCFIAMLHDTSVM